MASTPGGDATAAPFWGGGDPAALSSSPAPPPAPQAAVVRAEQKDQEHTIELTGESGEPHGAQRPRGFPPARRVGEAVDSPQVAGGAAGTRDRSKPTPRGVECGRAAPSRDASVAGSQPRCSGHRVGVGLCPSAPELKPGLRPAPDGDSHARTPAHPPPRTDALRDAAVVLRGPHWPLGRERELRTAASLLYRVATTGLSVEGTTAGECLAGVRPWSGRWSSWSAGAPGGGEDPGAGAAPGKGPPGRSRRLILALAEGAPSGWAAEGARAVLVALARAPQAAVVEEENPDPALDLGWRCAPVSASLAVALHAVRSAARRSAALAEGASHWVDRTLPPSLRPTAPTVARLAARLHLAWFYLRGPGAPLGLPRLLLDLPSVAGSASGSAAPPAGLPSLRRLGWAVLLSLALEAFSSLVEGTLEWERGWHGADGAARGGGGGGGGGGGIRAPAPSTFAADVEAFRAIPAPGGGWVRVASAADDDNKPTERDDRERDGYGSDDDGVAPCSLCLFPLERPASLPCGHVFCWGCVHRAAAAGQKRRPGEGSSRSTSRAWGECPLCRGPFGPGDLVALHGAGAAGDF